jgi:hypothetical protein
MRLVAIWRALRLALLGALMVGIGLSVALALGLADPPRHRTLYAAADALEASLSLPRAPFTLIAHGVWSAQASPLDSWHLIFSADGAPRFTLSLHGDASFALAPIQADALGFIHLRRPPEPNEVLLFVTEREALLYLNRELAWRGALPSAGQVSWRGALRSISVALYTP